jgi:hypothetical protein
MKKLIVKSLVIAVGLVVVLASTSSCNRGVGCPYKANTVVAK